MPIRKELFSKLFSFIFTHRPLVGEVNLVRTQAHQTLLRGCLPHVLDPLRHRIQGLSLRAIVDYQGEVGALEVGPSDGSKAFGRGGVPQLKLALFA